MARSKKSQAPAKHEGFSAAVISMGSESSKKTAQAMKKYFSVVDELDVRDIEVRLSGEKSTVLHKGDALKKYDCILPKGSFRYSPLLRTLVTLLSKQAYIPYLPDAFTIAHDKLLTQLVLQQKNIPMPATYLAATITAAKKVLDHANYPLIMKFPQGTQGKGVVFADSKASANSILDALSALKQPFLIQEYIETGTSDIRAFVVGEKVVAAMKRQGPPDEKRANLHAGAQGTPYVLGAHAKKIAVSTARSIGAGICGVDLLESAKGPLVIEANISPGLGISEITGVDIADKIAQFLFAETKKYKEQGSTSRMSAHITQTKAGKTLHIIGPLDFRGAKVLLPELVVDQAGFIEDEEYELTATKGMVTIKQFSKQEDA